MTGGEKPSYVYAIRAGDYVKIGKADNPRGRIDSFRTGNPHTIEPISIIEFPHARAAYEMESWLHHLFSVAGWRHDREWFTWSPRLEVEVLGLGERFTLYQPEMPECESQYDDLSALYLEGIYQGAINPVGGRTHIYFSRFSSTERLALGPSISRRIGPRDDISTYNLSTVFCGPYFDTDAPSILGVVDETDTHLMIHCRDGAYCKMPKVNQDRIAELLMGAER